MTAETAQHAPSRFGVRAIAALVVFILAALLTPIAVVGHWGHRTVIDSERYIATVGPLIEQPEVQEALSVAVTDAVVAQVDTKTQISGLLDTLFPDSRFNDALSAPIAAGINSLIGELVTRFIASDVFAKAWITLNEAAQKGLVRLLEGGEEGPVRMVGDDVVLDLSAALATIQQHLVDNGIDAAANLTIPESDRQIVLMNAPALAQLRLIYSLTSPILQWFPLIIAALFALAVALSRRRARIVVATGIVLAVWGFLLLLALGGGSEAFTNELAGTPFGPASTVFYDTLFTYLISGLQAILVLGIVLVIAGWFGGRTRWARLLRGHVTRGLDEIGDRIPALAPFRESVGQHVEWVRWAIYAVLVIILLLLNDVASPASVLWVTALGAGLVTATQLFANRSGEESDPDLAPTTAIPVTESTPTA